MSSLWYTANGEALTVHEMDDIHLINAINYTRSKAIKLYLIHRTSNYQSTNCSSIKSFLPLIYDELVDELIHRANIGEMNDINQLRELICHKRIKSISHINQLYNELISNKKIGPTDEAMNQLYGHRILDI